MATFDARLLQILRKQQDPLSMAELSQLAGASPAEVAAGLQRLEESGYVLERHPHRGTRLAEESPRLIAEDIEARCENLHIGSRIIVLANTHSTNDVAIRLGNEGARSGTVVFAESQSGGRGRHGREWHSAPSAGLWFSVLLRPTIPPRDWSRLPLWAASSVATAVEALTGLQAGIKWPNDIWLRGKKTCGILLETRISGDGGFVVAGIGLNINHRREDFPEHLRDLATSLHIETGRTFPLSSTAVEVLRHLDLSYQGMPQNHADILRNCTERSVLLGRSVVLVSGEDEYSGWAEGFDEDGSLQLRLHDGSLRSFGFGEVTRIRGLD
jgi:BirA family biotin operon repressor/biotin-[acetyl-CoA-carboxylase] ligase